MLCTILLGITSRFLPLIDLRLLMHFVSAAVVLWTSQNIGSCCFQCFLLTVAPEQMSFPGMSECAADWVFLAL